MQRIRLPAWRGVAKVVGPVPREPQFSTAASQAFFTNVDFAPAKHRLQALSKGAWSEKTSFKEILVELSRLQNATLVSRVNQVPRKT